MRFKSEFKHRLKEEFGTPETQAERVADLAARFYEDNNRDDTPEELIERMEKRVGEGAKQKWNVVVGFLDASHWSLGDQEAGDSPYKL